MKKIRELFRNTKLNIKFTSIIILFMVIPIGVLAGVLFYVMEQNAVQENMDYMEYTMQRNEDGIKTKIDSINMSTQFFLSDDSLLQMLNASAIGGEISTADWLDFKNNEVSALERLVNNNPLLYGVRVYAVNDSVQEMMPILYNASRMKKQEWSKQDKYVGWNFDYTDNIFNSYTMNQNRKIISLVTPNIGSYVGEDITAGAFVTMLWNQEPFSLFIDLGTNGEIVFGNSDFMFSCACSAGPAFEGGDISCGMRATDGAIEACTIDAETMEPKLTIVGNEGTKPVGICGSGIIDIISELFRCKIINPKGKFVREGRRVKRDADGMGSYVLAFEGEEAGSSKDVEITEVDIDSFIRAKGAIFSAIRTMLSYCDFDISMIENVYVAGGIGSGINMANAINIGMFPDIPVEMYHYVGNTSLAGAYAMLCSTESERKVYDLAANMTYIELSTIPQYMDEFVGACFLPHTDASLFPNR